MPTPPLETKLLQEAIDTYEILGDKKKSADKVGIPISTFRNRYHRAVAMGFKPSVRREPLKVHQRQRLGKIHMVIPDTQVKPGVDTDHLEWAGNYAAEKRPDVIIHIGDHWDMPSLSSYDKGKMAFEGRRYVHDVEAGKRAMEKFLKPIRDAKDYNPRLVFTLGNHEHRIVRYVENNPEFAGKFGFGDLELREMGWEVHDFLKPVEIDGILYCHYFTSGVMGRPVSSAAALLRERQQSCTMGHVQYTDMAIHKKTQNLALFCGTFYQHDEDYLGYQGNAQRRQIIFKHEVEDGKYDPMFVSLKFLEKNYS